MTFHCRPFAENSPLETVQNPIANDLQMTNYKHISAIEFCKTSFAIELQMDLQRNCFLGNRCAFGQHVFQYNCMKLWLGEVASIVCSSWECCVCFQCMHTFPVDVCFYHVLLRGCGICLGRFPNLLCSKLSIYKRIAGPL